MTKTKAPAAPQTHRSGHCGLRNPPSIHSQCLGIYSGYPCCCDCHVASGVEHLVVAEIRRHLAEVNEENYQTFLRQLARAVISIVQDAT
jgi:hypothetical protein